jgi:hypothetical protein
MSENILVTDAVVPNMRHDPTYLQWRRTRWCTCTCGWKSPEGTYTDAQLAFGRHLIAVNTNA